MEKTKLILTIGIIILFSLTLVLVKLVFYPYQRLPSRQQEDNIFESVQEISGELSHIFQNTKENAESMRKRIDDAVQRLKPQLSEQQIKDLKKEISERTIPKKDVFQDFPNLQDIIAKGWNMEVHTSTLGILGIEATRFIFQGEEECRKCINEVCDEIHNTRSKKILEFYGQEDKALFQDLLQKVQANLRGQQCIPTLLWSLNDYFILDACSNNIQCNDEEILEKSLMDYFQSYIPKQ